MIRAAVVLLVVNTNLDTFVSLSCDDKRCGTVLRLHGVKGYRAALSLVFTSGPIVVVLGLITGQL